MGVYLYWACGDDRDHWLCEEHGELRERGRDKWVQHYEGVNFTCEECWEERKLEAGGLEAHLDYARANDAWVVVNEAKRCRIDEFGDLKTIASELRATWADWTGATHDLAEARVRELVSLGGDPSDYSIRRASDVLIEDMQIELIFLVREARVR